MNLPFNIKLVIFDENKPISKTQEKLKETIIWFLLILEI